MKTRNEILLILLCAVSVVLSKDILSEEDASDEDDETVPRGEQVAAFVHGLDFSTTADYFNPCPGHSTGLAGDKFAELINTLILSGCILGAPCRYPIDVGGECRSTTVFDFIIVGGGTAGAVIAARLSEISSWNILLLEAGSDPPMSSDVPHVYFSLHRTDIDWGFLTVREKGLFNGLIGKVNRWPRGKVLGGTSTINAMLYLRGMRRDYDNLAADGNIGWSFEDVLPYFKKSEDMRHLKILGDASASVYHSRGGPLSLGPFGEMDRTIEIIKNATEELRYPTNHDINGPNLAGFSFPTQGTVKDGERINTMKAYVSPLKDRKNLFLIKHAIVSRVLICPQTMRAYAVEYYYKNERAPRILRASREIILSAGVIGSPKILMLSGIGPRNHLTDVGIHNLKNLRVGGNLQDHVMFPGLVVTFTSNSPPRTPLQILDSSYEYLTRRTGILSSIGVTELFGVIDDIYDDKPVIQIQFVHSPMNETPDLSDFMKSLGLDEEIALQYYDLNTRSDLLVIQPMVLHPKSKGRVTLRSNDYEDMPLIEAGYLNHPDDMDALMIGVKFGTRLASTEAMLRYNASLRFLNFRGCCNLTPGSDLYWACAFSHIAGTGHNQVGTCKMGPERDSEAVVDSQLRVHGVKGLRVADGSILPNALTGSPLAAIVMIGEKVSDMIKLCWIPDYQPWSTTRSPYKPTPTPPVAKKKKPSPGQRRQPFNFGNPEASR